MQFRLRTLLILLVVGPPLIAAGWRRCVEYRNARDIATLNAAIDAYRTHGRFNGHTASPQP
jgi:hypothetical protein